MGKVKYNWIMDYQLYVPGVDSGFRKGGVCIIMTLKNFNTAHSRADARRFFPLYGVWGSPKKGGGGVLIPRTPPPLLPPLDLSLCTPLDFLLLLHSFERRHRQVTTVYGYYHGKPRFGCLILLDHNNF